MDLRPCALKNRRATPLDHERHKQRNYSIKRYGVALMSLEATRTIVRGRQPRSGLVCFLCKLMLLMFSAVSGKHERYLLFLCSYVLLFSALAANMRLTTNNPRYGVSPYVSWATRTLVRGQPRSGLVCFLCKLMLLMFSALSG